MWWCDDVAEESKKESFEIGRWPPIDFAKLGNSVACSTFKKIAMYKTMIESRLPNTDESVLTNPS